MNNHNYHQQNLCRNRSRAIAMRRGVTVLEVMFATGIAIAGMLGIGSLLLVAGRQASESNRSLESQTLAQDWYNEFVTRGMDNPASWVWYQDFAYNNGGAVAPRFRRFEKQPTTLPFQARLSHSGNPPGQQLLRPRGKMSICIDPFLWDSRTLPVGEVDNAASPPYEIDLRVRETLQHFTESTSPTWYRPAVFPYYKDGFNPLTDSEYLAGSANTPPWADQPRMLRVTLAGPTGIINSKQVEAMFTSNNELTMFSSEDDRSLPAARGYLSLPAGGTVLPFKASTSPKYSWLATLSPLEQSNPSTEDYYTLSLAVLYNRDSLFAFSQSTGRRSPLPRPDDKPQSERLTWVIPLSGNFTGGSGGRVRLVASAGTDSSVSVGNWIMLSKHLEGTMRTDAVSGSRNVETYSAFRWYRIVATDEEPTEVPFGAAIAGTGWTADPDGVTSFNDNVWYRDVVLDGPDWDFLIDDPSTPNNPTDYKAIYPVFEPGVGLLVTPTAPTTGTLVKGVVAIHERVVEIPDIGDF